MPAALAGGLIAFSPHLAWNSLVPMPDTPYAWPIAAAVLLRLRNNVYRRIDKAENADLDGDGIPDVYRRPPVTGRLTD